MINKWSVSGNISFLGVPLTSTASQIDNWVHDDQVNNFEQLCNRIRDAIHPPQKTKKRDVSGHKSN